MHKARAFPTALFLATASFSLVAPAAIAQDSPDYGTAHLTWVQVGGATFVPLVSGTSYTTTTGPILRTAGGVGGTLVYFAAPIQVPSGALLKTLELDLCDSNPTPGYVQGTLVESDRLGNVLQTAPYILSDATGCQTKIEDLTSLNIVADNHTRHLWLQAIVGSAAETVGLAGMAVGYQLQVSAAPGSATFLDVPTNHPFFQFIEALAASGITGGCGGGNYCPDSSVTRGQMAVFLAKALGLQFQ